LRALFAERDSHTRAPGACRPIIAPGLATWTVVMLPSASSTSARKRL
jgi:hypothetical protein